MAGSSSKSAVAKGKRPTKTTPTTLPEKQAAQHKRQRLTPTSASKSVLEARPVELGKANWLKTEGQETLLAGYVGFKKVEDLRRLIISWPILVIWALFNENAIQEEKFISTGP
ncbi:SNF2-like protein [Penicillium solitum]|uniref:SNF2-like protein n=1 Tax=Penicillium solitum TaxID=60172 RepID=UPI0032C3DBB5|nr:SNF2-like protein [Penicillium solitum]